MAWRLWIRHRPFVAVRVTLTAPARVTGSFIGTDGSVIPGQVVKTPTRRAGVTLLRFPLRVTRAGVYKLAMHAEGIGQTTDASTTVRFYSARPPFPAWHRPHPLRVVVVRGAGVGLAASLRHELGAGYAVLKSGDAALYPALETGTPSEAVTVVVALDTVPLSTLSSLHSLLPELQIVGLTNSPALARRARAIGVAAVLPKRPSVAVLGNTIERLLYRRRP